MFNPKSMSDQELQKKIFDINKKLVWASRFSNSDILITQLQSMLEQCNFEYGERNNARVFKELNKGKKAETSLTVETETKAEKNNETAKDSDIIPKNNTRIIRTSTPVK